NIAIAKTTWANIDLPYADIKRYQKQLDLLTDLIQERFEEMDFHSRYDTALGDNAFDQAGEAFEKLVRNLSAWKVVLEYKAQERAAKNGG
ncbi:MAG: hypothetical protein L6R38_004879, partial [Xanthoria sp. 2 TBL-2021]